MHDGLSLDPDYRPLNILSIGGRGYERFLDLVVSHMRGLSFLLGFARSLNEGLEYLAENDIDLILLDPDLPDSKGIGTFMRIRGLTPEIPIVVITSRENEEMSLRMIKEGAHDCIFESQLRPSLLMRSLLHVIERKGWKEYIANCHPKTERPVSANRSRLRY
jgi:DNA-binding response OmpR family regulator